MPIYYPTTGGVTGIPVTTVNAKGDLLVGTADDTITRVPVGVNDTFLKADSAQPSGVTWSTVGINFVGKNVLDYGTTATLGTAFNAAVAALGSAGGDIWIPPGSYTVDTTMNLDSNVPIRVFAKGATMTVSAGVGIGLLVDGDNSALAPGCDWLDGIFDGVTASTQVLVKLRNSMRFRMAGTYLRRAGKAILFSNNGSVSSQPYCESNNFYGIGINGCTVGVDTEIVSGGNASFDQNRFTDCDFPNNGTSINLCTGADLFGFQIKGGAIWCSNAQTGIAIDGKCTGLHIQTRIEGTAATPTAGLSFGANATNLREGHYELNFVSNFTATNQVVINVGNPTQAITWEEYSTGRYYTTNSASPSSTEPWMAYRYAGDTSSRVEFIPTGGGQLRFGIGSGTPDTNLYRTAANTLRTDDVFRASVVQTGTKAGTPVDGDFAATPGDGAMAIDTTNHLVYFRSGGTWRTMPTGSARKYAVYTVAATNATGTWNADYVASGTTDNSATIQAAIDAAFAAGGGTVELSDGRFYIANSVKIKTGVWLKGQGKATQLRGTGSAWVSGNAEIETADVDTHAFGISDMRIEQPTSVGTPAQGYCHGIYINCSGGNFSGTIDTSPDPVPYIANIQFYKIKGTAIMASTLPTHTHTNTSFSDVRGATIQNIFALDSRDYGILFHGSDSYLADIVCGGGANTVHQFVVNGSNNRINGCKGYYAGQSCLYIGGNRNMVNGFEAQDAGRDGAIIAGNNNQVLGLVCDSAGRSSGTYPAAGLYDGVVLSGSRNILSFAAFNRFNATQWNTRCGINIGGSDNIISGTIDVTTNFTGTGGVKAYAGTRTGQTMMTCTVNGENLDEFRIGTGRSYLLAPTTAPTASLIPNSGWSAYYDEVGSRLTFHVKSSAGVVKTGSITLV